MNREDAQICLGCGPTHAPLVVELPRTGLCASCLEERGWTLESTADILRRLGVGPPPPGAMSPASPMPATASVSGDVPRYWRYEVVQGADVEALCDAVTTWGRQRAHNPAVMVVWDTLWHGRAGWRVVVAERVALEPDA